MEPGVKFVGYECMQVLMAPSNGYAPVSWSIRVMTTRVPLVYGEWNVGLAARSILAFVEVGASTFRRPCAKARPVHPVDVRVEGFKLQRLRTCAYHENMHSRYA